MVSNLYFFGGIAQRLVWYSRVVAFLESFFLLFKCALECPPSSLKMDICFEMNTNKKCVLILRRSGF
jgi:hypothetical protein